ncbi:MAG: exonuclease SbcCD subunit D [Planctomycetaceae bacterium]
MPFEPLRFVHAANAYLDAPPIVPGHPSPDLRRLLEDATLTAFDNVLQACLEHDVDFLLLTGNTFVEVDRSLRARVALISGLAMLGEAGIRTFVLPGQTDPPSAWTSIPGMPATVTVFGDDETEAVAVLRDGRVIASVGTTGVAESADSAPRCVAGHFRIGLQLLHQPGREPFSTRGRAMESDAQSFDYIAQGGPAPLALLRTETTLTHHPGTTQARSFDDSGPGGCTLIDVVPGRQPQCTLLPTAPVRYERLTVPAIGEGGGSLVQLMSDQLSAAPPADCERLRCVEWQTLADPGCAELNDPTATDRLTREAASQAFPESIHVLAAIRYAESEPQHSTAGLEAEFRRELQTAAEGPRTLAELGAHRPDWVDRLDPISGGLNAASVVARAANLGRRRLDADATQG